MPGRGGIDARPRPRRGRAAPGHRQAGRRHLGRRARRGSPPSSSAGSPTAWRSPGSPADRDPRARAPRRGRRGAARAGDRHHRLPRRVRACSCGGCATPARTLLPGTEVVGGADGAREVVLETTRGELAADAVVSCAGLHADRVARLLGHEPSVRIVPFRGEYHELHPGRGPPRARPGLPGARPRRCPSSACTSPAASTAACTPGPTPCSPWPARATTGAASTPRDLAGTLGVRRVLAARPPARPQRRRRGGAVAVAPPVRRQRAPAACPRSPTPTWCPPRPGCAPRRCDRDGSLVDDFLLERHGRVVHLLNAPSPAATASLEIARHVVDPL